MSEQTSERDPQLFGRLTHAGAWLVELVRPKKPEYTERAESLFCVDDVARQIGTNICDFASQKHNVEFVKKMTSDDGNKTLEVTKFINKANTVEFERLSAVLAYPDSENMLSFNNLSIARQRVLPDGTEVEHKDNHLFQFVYDCGEWKPSAIEFESVSSSAEEWHEDHRLAALWQMVELFHEEGTGELPASSGEFTNQTA